jgi:hypothetical protein
MLAIFFTGLGIGFGLATAMWIPLIVFVYKRGRNQGQIDVFASTTYTDAEKRVSKRSAELEADYAAKRRALEQELSDSDRELKEEWKQIDLREQQLQSVQKRFEKELGDQAEEYCQRVQEIWRKNMQSKLPPLRDVHLAHVLCGNSVGAKFYVSRGGRVTIDWSAGLSLPHPSRVAGSRAIGNGKPEKLFSDVAFHNRFSETIKPGSYFYTLTMFDQDGSLVEEGSYRLSVPTNEEFDELAIVETGGDGSSPSWLRKVRDKMRSEVKLVSLVKELQKTAHAEIDGLGLSPEDREAAFARIDLVAANFMGDGS